MQEDFSILRILTAMPSFASPKDREFEAPIQFILSNIKEARGSQKIHTEVACDLCLCVHTHADKWCLSLQLKLRTTAPKKWHRQTCLHPKGAPAQQLAEQVFWNSLAGTHKLTLSTTEESQPELRPREKLP